MDYKIDIRRILRAHCDTIISQLTGKPDASDWISFVIIPLLIAGVLVWFQAYMSDSIVGTLVSAFSIFVGLLLNVVVLLFDIVTKAKSNVKRELVRQTLANISFGILLSMLCIITALTTQITRWQWVRPVASFVSYFLTFVFVATLLMIVKRMYFLFEDEVRIIPPAESHQEEEWEDL